MLASRQPGRPGTEMTVHGKAAYEEKTVRSVYRPLGDTLSNKVQRNLLFDYGDDSGDTELATRPARCQCDASSTPASRNATAGTRDAQPDVLPDVLPISRYRRVASDDVQPRIGKRRISIALCHAVSATAAQIGPYVASCETLSVSPSSSSDTATSSTGST